MLTDFWYFLISLRATVPGLNLIFLFSLIPPSAGAVFLLITADLVAILETCLDFCLSPEGLELAALVVSIF